MGRVFDFAKRRIAGYIVFWILVLLFVGFFYNGNQPAQAAWLFVLFLAFIGSLLYTRRMKRRQLARRLAAGQLGGPQQCCFLYVARNLPSSLFRRSSFL